MAIRHRSAEALLLGVSSIGLIIGGAPAPARAQSVIALDAVTVLATKTPERTSESLAAVSTVGPQQLEQLMPSKPSDILFGVPGVWVQERADDPGTAVNIRGLQDFGRVAVVIDGARQNFQRTGHNADGVFYLDPEMIGSAEVVRGPVANIYGSGAIGGVVSFNTKDVDDILRPGQTWGTLTRGEIGSNRLQGSGSVFAATRANPNFDFMIGAVARSKSNYKDGDGTEIVNTNSQDWSGIVKTTLRPADGHQIKLNFLNYNTNYDTGQPFFFNFGPPFGTLETTSIYATHVQNQIANARWTYSRPDDRLFDFDGNVYWTRTITDQSKIDGLSTAFGVEGNIGDSRNFTINTTGGDLHNTSRFDIGPFRNAVTYGIDSFRDVVNTSGFGTVFTPSGERTVSGGFVQIKSNYSTWLEIIGAARYDQYRLEGGGFESNGNRVSPKITVGITPVPGLQPYVTYAEGYRAPAVTETLVAGIHPVFPEFPFLANPGLQPEVGKTKEVGLNLRYDNIFTKNDSFRGKFNVYRNDVDNFIELTTVPHLSIGQSGMPCFAPIFINPFGPPLAPGFCEQYQNVANARLQGGEFETMYDAGWWFAGLAGSHVRGTNLDDGQPLAKIPPDFMTTTIGARLFDRKLNLALRWQAVAAKQVQDIPVDSTGRPVFPPTGSYNLINFYAGYQINPDVLAAFSIENLLNEQYSRYMTAYPNELTQQIVAFPQPGITFKASLKVRFGDDYFKRMKS
ncbi:MAG TPA: TonB-dependent hemoglobin/transferrin/lactoferrin family receptor [Pseudolabrys sp.]|nr:TonB-dependent hemoglobin/transferrin/lactoferrin family receptor [Pseudolabrys sp.]